MKAIIYNCNLIWSIAMLIGFLVHILCHKDAEDESILYQNSIWTDWLRGNQAIDDLTILTRAPTATVPT